MKFKHYLLEKSFSSKDIPRKFFVAFDFYEGFEDLKKEKFENMSGISGSGNIKFNFLGVARDAMLVMDSEKVIKLNKLTRVMYDNPHYFLANDMIALQRIFNSRDNRRVLENILDYLTKEIKKDPKYKQLSHDAAYYSLFNMGWDWSKKLPKINNIKKLSIFLTRKINTDFSDKTGVKYNLEEKDVHGLLWNALLQIGKVYHDESEWILKNKTLEIPSKSKLFILVNPINRLTDLITYCIDKEKSIDSLTAEEKNKYITKEEDGIFLFMNDTIVQKQIDYGIMTKKLEKKYKVYLYNKDKFEKAKQRFFNRKY
jgi:hypothetical protein